jgi:hypothetical protein
MTESSSTDLAWAEPEIDIDVDEELERGEPVVADEQIRVLARENRLALRCEPADRRPADAPGIDMLDFRLRCVAHAHPECRFRWVRVSLVLPAGSAVADLVPRTEISEHPVKITHTYGGGLKFDIAVVPLGPKLSAERSTEQDVYFPKIATSGIDLGYALWDFTAVGAEPLLVDRPLRLLARVPAGTAEIPVRLTLRASVAVKGLVGAIPLIGRQAKTIPLQAQALPLTAHSTPRG